MSGSGQTQPLVTSLRPATLLNKDAASGESTEGPVDMQGYDTAEFDLIVGTEVDGAVFDAWVVESDEDNLGNATNVMDASNSSAQVAITQASANLNNTVRTLKVHKPKQRYVGVTVKTATQNITTLSVVARQYRGTGTNPADVNTGHEYVEASAYIS